MSQWILERFEELGERNCIAYQESNYTYKDLLESIHKTADSFSDAGVQTGEVVILLGDYSLDSIAALFALFKIKAIAAPVAPETGQNVTKKCTEAQASWIYNCESKQLTKIDNDELHHPLLVSLKQENAAGLILFSSGSTGRPKVMIHNADSLLAPFQKKRVRKLRILIFLLFDHIGGLNTLFNGLASGAVIVIPQSRDASEVASAIAQHRVNLLPASPTFLNLLLISGAAQKHDLSSLRFVTYGTEPMPESLLIRLKTELPKVALIQTFGTSETGISQTTTRASDSTEIRFEDGETETKIVNGELWLRSKSQILGYLNHDMSRFTEEGWFRTGDLVEEMDSGYLKIVGRREDLINVGGEKVTPSEVESVLLEITEIKDCMVYAETNEITGQNVAAEIVTDGSVEQRSLKRSIKQHCRQRLAAYKIPVRIRFTDTTTFSNRFKKMRSNA